MDAKSKANFINSVASGQEVACPDCQTKNKAGSKFCIGCGKKLIEENTNVDNKPAFAQVETPVANEPVKMMEEMPVKKNFKYVEPESVFAQGLPSWNIEPPQVVIRRKHK